MGQEMGQEITSEKGRVIAPTQSTFADRMRQAVLSHNSGNSEGGGVVRREDMNLNAVTEVIQTVPTPSVSSLSDFEETVISFGDNIDTWTDNPSDFGSTGSEAFLGSLPRADRSKHEFLLEVSVGSEHAVFCVRELPWKTAGVIESESYRDDGNDGYVHTYFSEEAERRETLREAIIWVANTETMILLRNQDVGFLDRISDEALSLLWVAYSHHTCLYSEDAKSFYDSAMGYFSCGSDGISLDPLIRESDVLFKMGGLTRAELNQYTKYEFDCFKIIERARHDAINAPKTAQDALGQIGGILVPKDTNEVFMGTLGYQEMPLGFLGEEVVV